MRTTVMSLVSLAMLVACSFPGPVDLNGDQTGVDTDLLEGADSLGLPGPVLCLDRFEFDFGVRQVGLEHGLPLTLESCGTEPLALTELAVLEGSSADFSLDLGQAQAPSADSPLELPPGTKLVIQVRFSPGAPAAPDGEEAWLPSVGTLMLTGNQPGGQALLPLEAVAVEAENLPSCPQAIIDVLQGRLVLPGTVLNLVGEHSFAPEGGLGKYLWEVVQPSGSQSLFLPSDAFINPLFEVNVPGLYIFRLTVWDDHLVETCSPDEFEVRVSAPTAFRVELSWPGLGDLDLHLANDYASGPKDCDADGLPEPWFDQPFDCFAGNPQPQWGSWDPGVEDDPRFSSEQQDDRSFEVIELDIPETRATYTAAVHYPAGQGLGKLSATVRIYLQEQLVREFKDVALAEGQLWWVATISWPEGLVQGLQTNLGPKVGTCQELLPR